MDIYIDGVKVETVDAGDYITDGEKYYYYYFDESYDGKTVTIGVVAKASEKANSDMVEVEFTIKIPKYLDTPELSIDDNVLTIINQKNVEYYSIFVITPSGNYYLVSDLVADASGTTIYDLSDVFDYILENYGEEREEGTYGIMVEAHADGYNPSDNIIEW